MEGGQLWRQYFFAGAANIIVASAGYMIAWTAPVIPKLRAATSSPLDAIPSADEIAWMSSVLIVGSMFGSFIGGTAAAKVGRKWGLICASIPITLGWILVSVAVNMSCLYAARVLGGISGGMIFTIVPMYCAEIATDDTRGALGSFLQAFVTLGCLLVYTVGPFISYQGTGYVGIACVITFVVVFFLMPDTPTYYLLTNDREAAASCLCTLRGRSRSGVDAELCKIEDDVKASTKKTASVLDIFRGSNFKALYISCALMFFQQFSGVNAMLFYMTDIFKDSGVDLDPDISTIIVGAVQFIASLITPFIVDRLGRRLLMLISSLGAAIGLILLGMFFFLAANGSELVTRIGFLPILSLVLFIVTYCCGLGPLPWAITGELFSIEVRAVATPIATAFCSVSAFLVTRFFEAIAIALGRYGVFWLFAVFCVISFFFSLFVLPESKGKSFQEIQDMLAGRKSIQNEKYATRETGIDYN